MKNMLKLPLVAVAIALAVPFSFAEEKSAPPPPPAGEQGPGPKDGPGRGGPRGDRFKAIVEQLNLTEEQKTKIKPIIEEEMKAMVALREDKSLAREARREKMMEIAKKTREQVRPLLTPEQQKKLDEMRGPGGPGGPRKEKKE